MAVPAGARQMADRMDLLELVQQAGWPYRRLANRGHYLVMPPGHAQAITIATGGGDWRSSRNQLAALRRAGLDQALAARQQAGRRQHRRQLVSIDQALAQRQAQADKLTQEREQHELIQLSREVRRRYRNRAVVGVDSMTLHPDELDMGGLDPQQMLSPNDVAEAMGVSSSRVLQLVHQGRLKATTVPGRHDVRYQVAWGDVVRFVAGNE